MNELFKDPESIFLTAKVKDILFDGVYIDCNVTDFLAKMACNQLKENPSVKLFGEDGVLFSFFGQVFVFSNSLINKNVEDF